MAVGFANTPIATAWAWWHHAKVGKDNVTGQAMYDAMLSSTFTEAQLMESLPDTKFDTTAPFPVGKLEVKVQVVRDGKITPLGNDWIPIPDLPRW